MHNKAANSIQVAAAYVMAAATSANAAAAYAYSLRISLTQPSYA
jgi:hypothetical protein